MFGECIAADRCFLEQKLPTEDDLGGLHTSRNSKYSGLHAEAIAPEQKAAMRETVAWGSARRTGDAWLNSRWRQLVDEAAAQHETAIGRLGSSAVSGRHLEL